VIVSNPSIGEGPMGNKKRELKKERRERDKRARQKRKNNDKVVAEATSTEKEEPKTAIGRYMSQKNKENGENN